MGHHDTTTPTPETEASTEAPGDASLSAASDAASAFIGFQETITAIEQEIANLPAVKQLQSHVNQLRVDVLLLQERAGPSTDLPAFQDPTRTDPSGPY